ncbi:hypothetical protein [Natrinema salaciae]|uniref:Uncharacterized protein n=1 Tax=Natrinema salaciae TaxID=1186196 RepID=A0A1H9G0F1_9EURY|nr:hypothetical protein [Natrinema salaciae]SEQ43594.1 hypothetical protein SAMN04489841_1734 [Natrinema salaciae]
MIYESLAWLRDRIDPSDIVVTVGLAVFLFVMGLEINAIATVFGIVIAAPLGEAAVDRFDIDPALAWIALGTFAVAGGIVQLRESGTWFGGSLVAVGCWICLDGLYAWRNVDATARDDDDMTKDEVRLVSQHNRWLLEELREADRPLTKAEICDRTGLLEDDFERLLEIHGDSGPIERVGNGYAIDDAEMGAGPFVRKILQTVGSRLLRPVRLFRPAG